MLLDVQNLSFSLKTYEGTVTPVRDVCFSVDAGEVVALVGESGCGKTMSCLSMLHLFPKRRGHIHSGSRVLFEGARVDHLPEQQWSSLRGAEIGMVFQDPAKSLSPTMKIGEQITDSLRYHKKLGRAEARQRAADLLSQLDVSDSSARMNQYPHELSGGLRQRVVIASAIACEPKLLVADEPTTALDLTIQAQILHVLKTLQQRRGMSILLITHNLGIVAHMAQRVLIMYGGRIVESGPTERIFSHPAHPYTKGLLASIPGAGVSRAQRLASIPGVPPDLRHPYAGCPFLPRCPHKMQICAAELPAQFPLTAGHSCRCHLHHPQHPDNTTEGEHTHA